MWTQIVNLRGPQGVQGKQGVIGLPGVNAVANDTATAGYISTEGTSATRTALDQRFVRRPRLKQDWAGFAGGVAMHQLGGASLPLESVEAARGNVVSGCAFLDADMRLTADGVPVLAHDQSLSIGTNMPSGIWREQQSANLGSIKWQPSRTLGGSWSDLPVVTIAAFLDEFGGVVPIILEPKEQTLLADWQASIAAVAPLIIERGLEQSVMIGMYGGYISTHASTVTDAGLMLAPFMDSAMSGYDDPGLIPTWQAAGVDAVALSSATSDSTVSAWVATGLPVFMSPSGRRWRWAQLQALGVDGCTDDYAIYLAGLNGTTLRAPWANGLWGSGDIPALTHVRPKLLPTGLQFNAPVNNYQCMLVGDFAPLPASYRFDFELKADTVPGGGSWFGLQVAATDDASWTNGEADPTGYSCLFGMAGGTAIWTRQSSTNFNRATSGTATALVDGNTLYGRVTITPTIVTVERLASAGGSVLATCSYTNSTWRGGYVHVGVFHGSGTASYTLKNLTVTYL